MIDHEELYDLDVCPDLAVDGYAILELMGEALAYVPSYTGKYATLREQVQNGLLTEREYGLIEEGRNI